MAPTTIQADQHRGLQTGRRLLQAGINRIRSEFGVEALLDSYYNPKNTTPSPIIFWWLGLNLLSSIPTSIYSQLTGQSTLPVSDPFGALMMVTMVGGLIVMVVAHSLLWSHGQYVKSVYRIRSPIVADDY